MSRSSDTHVYSLSDLLAIMAALRDPQRGCPWDLAQNFQTITASTLEECYELVDALERHDLPHVAEELGDVLFQIVFYCQLGQEQGAFSFDDIVNTLVHKLIRRHPHVFATDGSVLDRDARVSPDEVKARWEEIKQGERAQKDQTGLLADIPLALPSLGRAQKIQKRMAKVGFDFADAQAALAKVKEEMAELEEALASADRSAVQAELGDVLFSVVNVGRHIGIDSETALRTANNKVTKRIETMEQLAADAEHSLSEITIIELEHYWNQAKAAERGL
jgi:ATP diphosphatase